MATKPTVDPKWATDQIATDNIEPIPAIKTGGVPDGGTLGREHLNWMFNAFSQWIDWVRSSALDKDNNLSDLTNVATARTNLGLMTSATTIGANTSGNAATATKLATARTINGVSFDGTSNIDFGITHRGNATDFNTTYQEGTYAVGSGAIGGPYNSGGNIYGKLVVIVNTGTAWAGSGYWIWQIFTDTNNRRFSRFRVNNENWTSWVQETDNGVAINSQTAYKLSTARTISLTGDVSGSTTFDGSANKSIACTVADNSHNHTLSNLSGFKYGTITIAGNTDQSVNLGSTVVTAMAVQNSLDDYDSGGVGVTWSGSNITIRNSYGNSLKIVYWAWVS